MLTDLLDMYIEMDPGRTIFRRTLGIGQYFPDAKLPPDEVERRLLKTVELKTKFEIRMSIKNLEAAQPNRNYMPPTIGPIGMPPRQPNAPRHWIDIERQHLPGHTPINFNHPARYASRTINPYNPAALGSPHQMQPVNQLQLQPPPQSVLSTPMPMPYNSHYNPTNTFRQLNMYTQTFY